MGLSDRSRGLGWLAHYKYPYNNEGCQRKISRVPSSRRRNPRTIASTPVFTTLSLSLAWNPARLVLE
jgi:hypothetical protein